MTREDYLIFLQAMSPEDPLAWLREEALSRDVPIIRPDSLSFLRTLTAGKQPRRILEIGGGIAYSALEMAQICPKAQVDSIESDTERVRLAEQFIDKTGSAVKMLEGDAQEVLKHLDGPYDLIFLDGPKAQYGAYWPKIRSLLAPGGWFLADNLLQEETLPESRFAVERRDRTIHRRLREFAETVLNDPAFTACLVQVGDGMLWAVKEAEYEV